MRVMATAVPGTQCDVVVVGGRVAGALTAAHLAALGLTVTVLESSAMTSGTISTHFFRGDGLVRGLFRAGLLDDVLATGAPRLTCEYSYSGGGPDPTVGAPQEPAEFGFCLSVRREALDPLMAARIATTPGVTWLNHRRVVGLIGSDPVRGVLDAEGAKHYASVVVGADGRRSTMARLVGAPKKLAHPAARLLIYRYVSGYSGPSDEPGPEFSMLGNELAYAFPSDHGITCIALTVPLDTSEVARRDMEGFFDTRLAEHQGIAPRYRASTPRGQIVAGRPSDDYVRQAAGPGWALVGDAGTHQDPWSGAGMDTAARQAAALADTLAAGFSDWPSRYAEARDRVTLDCYTETVAAAPDLRVLLAG